MNAFPFTQVEWRRVSELAGRLTNAALADDDVLHASLFVDLQDLLADLSRRHGEHPGLWETEADFTDDPNTAIALYEQAKQLALRAGLPTYTIRISLARVLIDQGDAAAAGKELRECRSEVAARGDDHEKAEWQELLASCDRDEA
jgi:hypothetical protein